MSFWKTPIPRFARNQAPFPPSDYVSRKGVRRGEMLRSTPMPPFLASLAIKPPFSPRYTRKGCISRSNATRKFTPLRKGDCLRGAVGEAERGFFSRELRFAQTSAASRKLFQKPPFFLARSKKSSPLSLLTSFGKGVLFGAPRQPQFLIPNS